MTAWLVARRLSQLIPVLFGVTVATFLLLNLLPGDPARAVAGLDASEAVVETVRDRLGLDRPLVERYTDWVGGVVQGDLGESYDSGRDIAEIIIGRMPASIHLLVSAQILALCAAVPLACLAASRRDSWWDRAASTISYAGVAMPNFFFAIVLILLFAVHLEWLPSTGYVPLGDGVLDSLRSTVLPAVTLAAGAAAVYTRVLRNDLITALEQDYVLASRARGAGTIRVLTRHGLRNSLLPLTTMVGLNMGHLLGGAVIVETIFAFPGIGRLLIDAVYNRDLPVVQAVVLVVAVAYVVINLLVDLAYNVLDPRIRDGISGV